MRNGDRSLGAEFFRYGKEGGKGGGGKVGEGLQDKLVYNLLMIRRGKGTSDHGTLLMKRLEHKD